MDEATLHDEQWYFYGVIQCRDTKAILLHRLLLQAVLAVIQQHAADFRVQLWGYVILPDAVQLVLEVLTEASYHHYMDAVKAASEARVVGMIQTQYPDLLDKITYYNPAWPKPIYALWQKGYHTQLLGSVYALSNKIADLVQKPVALGLVEDPGVWEFSSYQGVNTEDN